MHPGFSTLTTWESRSIHSFKGSDFGSGYAGEIINSLHSQTLRISTEPIHTTQRPVFVHKCNTQWPAVGCLWGLLDRWRGQDTGKSRELSACHIISHSLCLCCWYAHVDKAGKPTASGSFHEVMRLIGVFWSREAEGSVELYMAAKA